SQGDQILIDLTVIPPLVSRVLSCHQTEYEISGECCPMCPPAVMCLIWENLHCTEFRSTSCMPCTEGTYNEKSNGLQYCSACSLCDSGSGLTVKHGCTLTSDSVCEPLDGFFCVDSSSKSCSAAQKHSSCEKGQYISQRGTASTDTECSDCSSGTFSDGTGESCQPHRQCEAENLQLTEAGTSSTDAQCGEQRQDVSAVVIGVLVPAVVLVVTAAVVVKPPTLKHNVTLQKTGGGFRIDGHLASARQCAHF
uniref:TNFR-Cys domain-containing protein n=1 Tax=Oryzias latipes TaxID=8090 RepID=A0A3P9LKF2_ORYLA